MQLLTVQETAALLRVSPFTIRRYIASGKLEGVRVGRNVRIDRNAVTRLVSPELTPTAPNPKTPGEGREFTFDSPLWDIVGMIEDDGPNDLSITTDAYLADAYADNHDR